MNSALNGSYDFYLAVFISSAQFVGPPSEQIPINLCLWGPGRSVGFKNECESLNSSEDSQQSGIQLAEDHRCIILCFPLTSLFSLDRLMQLARRHVY